MAKKKYKYTYGQTMKDEFNGVNDEFRQEKEYRDLTTEYDLEQTISPNTTYGRNYAQRDADAQRLHDRAFNLSGSMKTKTKNNKLGKMADYFGTQRDTYKEESEKAARSVALSMFKKPSLRADIILDKYGKPTENKAEEMTTTMSPGRQRYNESTAEQRKLVEEYRQYWEQKSEHERNRFADFDRKGMQEKAQQLYDAGYTPSELVEIMEDYEGVKGSAKAYDYTKSKRDTVDSLNEDEKTLASEYLHAKQQFDLAMERGDMRTAEETYEAVRTAGDKLKAIGWDSEKISKTAQYLQEDENEAAMNDLNQKSQEFINEHPVLGGAAYVTANTLMAPAQGFSELRSIADAAVSGRPLDTNASPYKAIEQGLSYTGQKVEDKYGAIGKFAFDAGTSFLASRATMAVGGWAGEALTLPMFGMSAFASTYRNDVEKGIGEKQALAHGFWSGLAEAISEKLPMDNMIEMYNMGSAGQLSAWKTIKQTLMNMGVEGLEEAFSDFADNLADISINGHMSEYMTNIRNYRQAGYNERQAKLLAENEFWKEVAYDFGVGAVSAGLSTIPAAAQGKRAYKKAAKSLSTSQKESLIELAKSVDAQGITAQSIADDVTADTMTDEQAAKLIESIDEFGGQYEAVEIALSEILNEETGEVVNPEIDNVSSEVDTLNAENSEETAKSDTKSDENPTNATGNGTFATEESTLKKIAEKAAEIKLRVIGQEQRFSIPQITRLSNNNAEINLNGRPVKLSNITYANERQQKTYSAAVSRFGTNIEAANAFIDMVNEYKGNRSVDMLANTAQYVYKAGLAGGADFYTIENSLQNRGLIEVDSDNNTLKKIYEAGTKQRLAENPTRTVPQHTATSGKVDVQAESNRAGVKMTELLMRKLGTDAIYKAMDNNGSYNPATGQFNFSNTATNDFSAIAHEVFGEFLNENNREGFEEIQSVLMDYAIKSRGIDNVTDILTAYKKGYTDKDHNPTMEDAAKEWVADHAGDILFGDEEGIRSVVEWSLSENGEEKTRSFVQKVVDFIDKLVSAIKKYMSGHASTNAEALTHIKDINEDDIREIRKMWLDAMDIAIASYNANAIESIKADQINADNANVIISAINGSNGKTVAENQKQMERIVGTEMYKAGEEVGGVERSLSLDKELMDAAIKKNATTKKVPVAVLSQAEMQRRLAANMLKMVKQYLPEDIAGNIVVGNASYGKSVENSLICVRSLVNNWFMDEVSEKVGRPLSVEEQLITSQILAETTGDQTECNYCYVATDRRTYRASFTEYFNQYKEQYDKVQANIEEYKKNKNFGYEEFLKGRKDTAEMKNRYWKFVDDALNSGNSLALEDLTTATKRNELKGKNMRGWLIEDAERYAQAATWAKKTNRKVKGKALEYIAYNGNILRWGQPTIDKLNADFGLRMYSFSDYVPQFVLENMQVVTDAAVKGLKMLSYTKDVGYAKIFAQTGMGINISVFGEWDADHNTVAKDEMMGANWDDAKKIREQYPNVGTVFVGTNDQAVEWALDQDWIDVVIPYHLVRTGTEVANFFKYTNYKAMQEDRKTAAWTSANLKSIPPTVHGNNRDAYLKALKDNNLTPRFEKWIDHPNYMKLVNETRMSYKDMQPVQPLFDMNAVRSEIGRIRKEGSYGTLKGMKTEEQQREFLDDYVEKAAETVKYNAKEQFSKNVNLIEDTSGRELSEEQKEFFKDSKVRTEDGKLMVMYHGSNSRFTVFDRSAGIANGRNFGDGFYFTNKERDAKYWGRGTVYECYLNIKNPFYVSDKIKAPEGILNILRENLGRKYDQYSQRDSWWGNEYSKNEWVEKELERSSNTRDAMTNLVELNDEGLSEKEYARRVAEEKTRILRELGYDGVVVLRKGDGTNGGSEVVAFDQNQIKNVDNTAPTEDADIRFSEDIVLDEAINYDQQQSDMNTIVSEGMGLIEEANLSEKAVRKVAREIIKETGSSYKTEDLTKELTAVFSYIKTNDVTADDISRIMTEVARPILEQTAKPNPQAEADYKEFMDYIKSKNIRLNQAMRENVEYASDSYNAFRKSNMWRLNLSNKGTNLDEMWSEIVDHSYGMLQENIPDADMPLALVDFMDALKPKAELPGSIDEASYSLALDIFGRFFQEQSQEALDERVKQRVAGVRKRLKEQNKGYRERIKAKEQEKLKSERMKLEEERRLARMDIANQIRTLDDAELERANDLISKEAIRIERERMKEKAKRLNEQNTQKIAELRSKNDQRWRRAAQTRRDTELKNKIKKNLDNFNQMLAHPSEKSHIPVSMVSAVIDVCEMVDIDRGTSQALKERMNKLRDLYSRYRSDSQFEFDYDERTMQMIEELGRIMEDKTIYHLTTDELQKVYNLTSALKQQIANANKLIENENKLTDIEIAEGAMEEMRQSRKNIPKGLIATDKYDTMHLNAYRWFRKVSGWNDNSYVMSIYRELEAGQMKAIGIQKDVSEMFREVLADQNEVKKLVSTKDLVDVGLRDKNGNPVMVTRAMRLSIIMHTMNDQNLAHMVGDGLTIPDIKLYEAGKYSEAYEKGQTIQFMPHDKVLDLLKKNDTETLEAERAAVGETLKNLRNDLSDYEKRFLAVAEEFFHNYTGKQINKVSEVLKGYALARVKNYFPIKTDSDFTKTDFSGLVQDGTLEGMGFLKERVYMSRNPIMLEDINKVIMRQTQNVAKYAGYAIPVRDLNRVMNVTNWNDGSKSSMKSVLRKEWGTHNIDYLQNLMQDIQGGRNMPSTIFDELRSKFAGATLTLNPSVAIKQAASYPTAGAKLGLAPLAKALGDVRSKPIAELEERNPLLWNRSQGYINAELGDIKDKKNFGEKLPKALDWITGMDYATVRTLEYASMYHVDAEYKHLTKGSEAYWNKVSEVFTEVVEQTQPNYTVLQTADIVRNPNQLIKQFVMFKTQPLQNFGIIYDAVGEYLTHKDKKSAVKLTKAVTSQLTAAMVFSMMTFAADMALHRQYKYKDDDKDEEMSLMKILQKLGNGIGSSISGGFLGGTEIYNYVYSKLTGETYYGFEISVFSNAEDFRKALENIYENASKLNAPTQAERNKAWFNVKKNVEKAAGYLGSMLGIPVTNVVNIAKSAILYTEDIVKGDKLGMNYFEYSAKNLPTQNKLIEKAREDGDLEKARELETEKLVESETYGDLYKAVINMINSKSSNTKELQKVVDGYLKAGKKESDIKSQITKNYKQWYLDAKGEEKAQIKNTLISVYRILGEDESKAKKKIEDWETE